MRKISSIIVLSFCMLNIPKDVNAENPSFTLYTGAYSNYLLDNGMVFHNDPVLQSELMINLPKGFYLDMWHSIGMDGSGPSSGLDDELDYTAGWKGDIKGLTLNIGILYMDIVDILNVPRGDVVLPYAEAGKVLSLTETQILNPFAKVQPAISAKGDYPKGGLYWGTGLRHLYQINPKMGLGEELMFIHDSGAFGFDNGWLFKYAVNVNRKLFGPFSLDFPMLKFTAPLSGMNDRKKETSVGVRLGMNF
ncbi:MAG: hypothetical protein HZB99_03750 [Candidatus Harrisonbacteria bacterium]|nr:hypothetical protein [Candidatus Harrisonbacteria bacterium]